MPAPSWASGTSTKAKATLEQIAQTVGRYANDEETHAKLNEAYGRDADDGIEFCARFNADGSGEMDTGTEVVSLTWEAANEGAVTSPFFRWRLVV